MSNCVAVIPAHNEEATIGPLVECLRQNDVACIVVDDASTDETAHRAEAAGAVVERRESQNGVGAATRTGLLLASSLEYTRAVTLDGDGQHDPSDVIEILEGSAHNWDLVVGSRFSRPDTAIPETKRISNALASAIVGILLQEPLPDVSCGLRVYNLSRRFGGRTNGYGWLYESLVYASRNAFRVASWPVRAIYGREALAGTPLAELLQFLSVCCQLYAEFGYANDALIKLQVSAEHRQSFIVEWCDHATRQSVRAQATCLGTSYTFSAICHSAVPTIRLR